MSEKKNSTARIQANNRYNKKAYDMIGVSIPKGRKEDLKKHAQNKHQTINALVNDLLRSDMGLSIEEWKRKPEQEQKE